ncbi:NlpC/P60 family protein [Pectobacteriaceae bacterium CE70]|uniref:Endopeptidase n=1 Tax=Serratia sp. (strain ATCC 39006) TaxID=104623 RepID=A0A2I5TJM5_SERS3|nr:MULTISPECIES: NlpC/P60 family protein [Enterobacterales]WJV60858.1 NlpC/P60 family protein [Pectobacteriaceae bacterium C52]WJV68691.1 NlpC/P60 family protein [Pectobacteriaceae bacterium CE70]WJY12619.1 NlpC/P60 family protein [Pectobacteriaceae bacterium C80]AUH00454.1 endopeptidase [Serratia sp. ATCC 39006]AUH04774.1 endopeptidase [Serratia sp. ATCC 39006]
MILIRWRYCLLLASLALVGCSSHVPQQSARLSNSAEVVIQLDDQLSQWQGTPYRYGGLDHRGIDCSGFVYLTFRDRFGLILPRSTEGQTEIGTPVDRDDLLPGDLIFFKTGSSGSGLHVGIYDTDAQFIHASTSRGVIRSSLDNVYWQRAYWQARRI